MIASTFVPRVRISPLSVSPFATFVVENLLCQIVYVGFCVPDFLFDIDSVVFNSILYYQSVVALYSPDDALPLLFSLVMLRS